jgi:DNA-binding ferritin-like protein
MSKTIWVRCKQVVEFSQQHEVTDEAYEILKEQADGCDVSEPIEFVRNSPYSILEGLINYNDITDCEREFTDVSIELYKPKKKGK